jgi:hypothetical protein
MKNEKWVKASEWDKRGNQEPTKSGAMPGCFLTIHVLIL